MMGMAIGFLNQSVNRSAAWTTYSEVNHVIKRLKIQMRDSPKLMRKFYQINSRFQSKYPLVTNLPILECFQANSFLITIKVMSKLRPYRNNFVSEDSPVKGCLLVRIV